MHVTEDRFKTLEELEREHILYALWYFSFNKTHTACGLAISIRTLRNKIKEYGFKEEIEKIFDYTEQVPIPEHLLQVEEKPMSISQYPTTDIMIKCHHCTLNFAIKYSMYYRLHKLGKRKFFCSKEHYREWFAISTEALREQYKHMTAPQNHKSKRNRGAKQFMNGTPIENEKPPVHSFEGEWANIDTEKKYRTCLAQLTDQCVGSIYGLPSNRTCWQCKVYKKKVNLED